SSSPSGSIEAIAANLLALIEPGTSHRGITDVCFLSSCDWAGGPLPWFVPLAEDANLVTRTAGAARFGSREVEHGGEGGVLHMGATVWAVGRDTVGACGLRALAVSAHVGRLVGSATRTSRRF